MEGLRARHEGRGAEFAGSHVRRTAKNVGRDIHNHGLADLIRMLGREMHQR